MLLPGAPHVGTAPFCPADSAMMVSCYVISWIEGDTPSPTVRTRWTIEEAYQMAFSCIDSGMVAVSLTSPNGEVLTQEQLEGLRPR
jgi:hypothetical protein